MTLPELFEAVTEATLASGDGASDIDSVLAADVRARAFVGEYLKSR
jgi:hypothetical protein